MQTRHMERFIGINVAQPSDERLVEQQGFELTAVSVQTLVKFSRVEISI